MKRSCIDRVNAALSIVMVLAITAGILAGPAMALHVDDVGASCPLKEPVDRAKTGPIAVQIDNRPPQAPDQTAFAAGGGLKAERGRFELP